MNKITIVKYKDAAEIQIAGTLNINNIDNVLNDYNSMHDSFPELKILGVNCELMEGIDSSGFGMLISLSRQSEKNGVAFYVCELNKNVSALFDISHLDKFFNIIPLEDFRKIVRN